MVNSDDGCPNDYEALIHRVWNGTKEFCFGAASDSELKLTEYKSDSVCDGEIIEPIPPMNMTVISGRLACAKRGGPTFVE